MHSGTRTKTERVERAVTTAMLAALLAACSTTPTTLVQGVDPAKAPDNRAATRHADNYGAVSEDGWEAVVYPQLDRDLLLVRHREASEWFYLEATAPGAGAALDWPDPNRLSVNVDATRLLFEFNIEDGSNDSSVIQARLVEATEGWQTSDGFALETIFVNPNTRQPGAGMQSSMRGRPGNWYRSYDDILRRADIVSKRSHELRKPWRDSIDKK